jgi:hypothetical protein
MLGPNSDRSRLYQFKDVLKTLYEKPRATSSPLYIDRCRAIVEELVASGFEVPDSVSPEQAVWEHLASRCASKTHPAKLVMSRFLDCVKAARLQLPSWHADSWEATAVCLELGMLKRTKHEKVFIRASPGDDILEGGSSTHKLIPTINDKLLRSCADNALVIRALFLVDIEYNKRVIDIVFQLSRPVEAYAKDTYKDVRDCFTARDWLVPLICGDFMKHVLEILDTLSNIGILQNCGFHVNLDDVDNIPDGDIRLEDEFADLLGQGCFILIMARLRRHIEYFSWPWRMLRILRGGGLELKTIGEFHEMVKIFRDFLDKHGANPTLKHLKMRHLCNHTSVKWFMCCFDELGYKPCKEAFEECEQRSLIIGQTVLVEELIGVGKSCSELKKCRKTRRPETTYQALLDSDIVGARHTFTPVPLNLPPGRKMEKLIEASFRPAQAARSFDFSGIASTTANASFYHPSATNYGTPWFDQQLLKDTQSTGFVDASLAAMGMFSDVQHRVTFRKNSLLAVDSPSTEWYIGLWHAPLSSCLVWPCTASKALDIADLYFLVPRRDVFEPCRLTITDWKSWKAASITWRSWAWQRKNCKKLCANVEPAVRAFFGKPLALKDVAAEEAFFTWGTSEIATVCEHVGSPLKGCKSLTESIFHGSQGILTCSDAHSLSIVAKRIGSLQNMSKFSEELLHVDGAEHCFDFYDLAAVQQESLPCQCGLVSKP